MKFTLSIAANDSHINWVFLLVVIMSAVQGFINMFRHRINLGIKFLLNLNHIFLVSLCYKVDCQTDLSKSSTAANPM